MHVSRRSLALVATLSVAAAGLGMPAVAEAATVLNVPSDYATIQAAIDAAADGDTVRVAPGTYVERITINKDITVESSGGADVTTIDGSKAGTVVTMPSAPGEVRTLRGFTVTNGHTTTAAGGISTRGGPALIEQNRIVGNTGCSGVGVEARFSEAIIQDNMISDNHEQGCSGGRGGGVYIGGDGHVQLLDNTIANNGGVASGGGVYLNAAGQATITGNTISRNSAGNGGGIDLLNASEPLIANNLIIRNSATGAGGGISWLVPSGSTGSTIVNNTIAANSASTGSAIYADGFDASVQILNNVIVSSNVTAVTCTATFDPAPPIFTSNDVFHPTGFAYGATCGTPTGSNGNISVDPVFIDASNDDHHLRPDSPLIDAGQDAGAPAVDFEGDARPYDGDEDGTATTDIGFDEAIDPLLILPAAVDFGSVTMGIADTPKSVTLTNLGDSLLNLDTVAVDGTNAIDFTLVDDQCNDGNGVISPSDSCTIEVGFTPSAVGSRAATLSISGQGMVGTRTIALSGIGLDPVDVSPATVSFGSVAIGSADTPVDVTVSNVGGSQVSVTSVSLSGPIAADFSIPAQTCTGAPIAAGSTCSVTVVFKPTAVGVRAATLTITGPSPVGTRTVDLGGDGVAPASPVSWGTGFGAGPAYTWNEGGGLALTVQSGAQRLHLAYATDRISGRWARDSGGPYAGVDYTRSGSGSTWNTPVRLNPTSQHGARPALSAYGSRIYVAWVSQAGIYDYPPTAPRALYVRVNTNHGASTSWRTAVRLTSTTGRVDFPSVASWGTDLHVAWTDSVTGAVRTRTSRDSGRTWRAPFSVGVTSASNASGRTGLPVIAARGSTVAVVWLADNLGTIKGRISTDRGVTWGALTTIGTGSISGPSVSVRGSRVAVVWPTPSDVVLRQRVAGTWADPVSVATVSPATSTTFPYSPTVVLQDPSRIGVSWAEATDGSHSRLRWVESANGGTTWYAPQALANPTPARAVNDWPSVVWPTAVSRYVAWNGWTPGTTSYRQYIRRGTGTPTGPTSVAAAWTPPEPSRQSLTDVDGRVLDRSRKSAERDR